MSDQAANISNAFLTFGDEAPQQAMAWGELVQKMGQASALDGKTAALSCAWRAASPSMSRLPKRRALPERR
jgi:hypothetical protein